MKMKLTEKHKLGTADIITIFRIAGTLVLLFLRSFSVPFFCVYALTGLTDMLDGFIARKTHTESSFGARLDSIADLLFYTVMLIKIFPTLWTALPKEIWYAVAAILIIRISAYLTAAFKYRLFASLHTYLNKLTGLAVFLIPFLIITKYSVIYSLSVCAVAALASLEELVILITKRSYDSDTKSLLQDVLKKR